MARINITQQNDCGVTTYEPPPGDFPLPMNTRLGGEDLQEVIVFSYGFPMKIRCFNQCWDSIID